MKRISMNTTKAAGSVVGSIALLTIVVLFLSSHPESDPTQLHDESANGESEEVVHIDAETLVEFGIELAVARSGSLETTSTFPGKVGVNQDRFAHIVPRVSGVVRMVHKQLGDQVQAGEILAVIESRELAETKSTYLAALERLRLHQATYDRETRLFQRQISSEQEYLEAEQVLAEARIELQSARSKLLALGISETYLEQLPIRSGDDLVSYPLTAPIDGIIVEKHIVMGEMLSANFEAFSVADLDTVWVDLSIYQLEMDSIREGQQVWIESKDYSVINSISFVQPILNNQTRTATARVILPNPDHRWRPGMFVQGRILTDTSTGSVVVPRSALITLDDKTVVFIQSGDGFRPHPVQLGAMNEESVVIQSGLEAGEIYVARGGFTMKAELQKSESESGHGH